MKVASMNLIYKKRIFKDGWKQIEKIDWDSGTLYLFFQDGYPLAAAKYARQRSQLCYLTRKYTPPANYQIEYLKDPWILNGSGCSTIDELLDNFYPLSNHKVKLDESSIYELDL